MKTNNLVLVASSMNGGAEAVAPVVTPLRARGAEVRVISCTPATETFSIFKLSSEKLKAVSSAKLRALLKEFKPASILTGTQFQSKDTPVTLEQMLWQIGKEEGIRTVAVMDTWGSELERFSDLDIQAPSPITIINSLTRTPAKIALIDTYQEKNMLELGFPRDMLAVTGNPYFEHVANTFFELPADTRKRLLAKPVFSQFDPSAKLIVFMSDCMNVYPDLGFTETSVLQSFLKVLNNLALSTGEKINLIVRSHPFRNQDAASAFDFETPNMTKVLHNPITARGSDSANEYSMEELLLASDLVVGTFNNPLVTAKIVGKPVINYVPNIAPRYHFQEFLSEQGMTSRVTEEGGLAGAIQSIFSGEIVQKSMEAVQGATERVIQLLQLD